VITKRLLREDVRMILLEQLLQGAIAPGSRINEVVVAGELGVSRTPLREALLHLERDGFLRSDATRGFFVLPLTVAEVKETYPILWTLELLALDLVDESDLEQTEQLRQLNDAMRRETELDRILELDTQWHTALLAHCPNQRLLEMINNLKKIIHRYELAYVRDAGLVKISVSHHDEITRALEAADRTDAGLLLEQHWRHGMESLVARIADKDASRPEAEVAP
jgi:DNA-binding GntR family transcriptional regulator